MNTKETPKQVRAFGYALAVASVVNSGVVIAKEKSPAVMAMMQRLTGHHWVTHSLIVLVIFFGLGFGLTKLFQKSPTVPQHKNLLRVILGGVGLGCLLIVAFYLISE